MGTNRGKKDREGIKSMDEIISPLNYEVAQMGTNWDKKDREGIRKSMDQIRSPLCYGMAWMATITPTFSENLKCFNCFKLRIRI